MSFAPRLLLVLSLLAGLPTAPAVAQTDASADTLYQSLGAAPGVTLLVDDFVQRLTADPRLAPFFRNTDLTHLRRQLADQFCEVSGGPCRLKGPDMKTAHAQMDVTKRDFFALVEVLQQSMSAQGIPFTTQNQLLARLAPMHRDIINTP